MTDLAWLPRDNELKNHTLANVTPATAPPTVRYEHRPLASPDGTVVDGLATAWITLDNLGQHNSYTTKMVKQVILGFQRASSDRGVVAVVFTGAGDKAFCTGGDQSAHEGNYDGRGVVGLPIDEIQGLIRDTPKPVIARVNGFAIGGGNVLVTLCDLAIASENAKFGQVGPKVGSFDAGWGTALLARVVGEKKAREIWFLNETYTAKEAAEFGLINKVVPQDELDAAVTKWTDTLGERSPTSLAFLKRSFNADSDSIRGISNLALHAVKLYYATAESKEGVNAFNEKRKPDFHKFVD